MSTPFPLTATDGLSLSARLFPTDGPDAGAVVLVCGATGVPQRYYARFATFLAARGLPTVTFDYRGIGGSRPPGPLRGFAATMSQWGERDMAGAFAAVRQAFPGRRLLVVGHSVGGQLLGLAPGGAGVDAVLMVGSQFGYWRRFPERGRIAFTMFVLLPVAARLLGHVPGWMGTGEDLPRGVAEEWARWCRHPDYLLRESGAARREGFAAVRAPIRAYSFSDDGYAPRSAVDALLSLYAGAPREHLHLTPADVGRPVGHFGFFREPFQALLWGEAADWLQSHAAHPLAPANRGPG